MPTLAHSSVIEQLQSVVTTTAKSETRVTTALLPPNTNQLNKPKAIVTVVEINNGEMDNKEVSSVNCEECCCSCTVSSAENSMDEQYAGTLEVSKTTISTQTSLTDSSK